MFAPNTNFFSWQNDSSADLNTIFQPYSGGTFANPTGYQYNVDGVGNTYADINQIFQAYSGGSVADNTGFKTFQISQFLDLSAIFAPKINSIDSYVGLTGTYQVGGPDAQGYYYVGFPNSTSTNSITFKQNINNVNFVAVAGGGGGGGGARSGNVCNGGGGGGGGVLHIGTTGASGYTYSVVVGSKGWPGGGYNPGGSGTNTTITSTTPTGNSITCYGGVGGPAWYAGFPPTGGSYSITFPYGYTFIGGGNGGSGGNYRTTDQPGVACAYPFLTLPSGTTMAFSGGGGSGGGFSPLSYTQKGGIAGAGTGGKANFASDATGTSPSTALGFYGAGGGGSAVSSSPSAGYGGNGLVLIYFKT